MGAIHILPDRVANQIAAGEVVERPVSIVKELVENALDAGATRIEIEFRHGGRSLICVEDNGCGMSRDDALLSLERHATSKIREAADLDHVLSFGFRGEALPSIASVSRFTMQTRDTGSESGTEIVVNGGRIVHVRDCGMPVGTRVVVSNLFNSVPARRKFLKSDATESAHIIHHSRLHALANPDVSFVLVEDGRTLLQSPVCSSLAERVGEVFGRQIASELLPVDAQDNDLHLRGLISRPGVVRATRHELATFVNRRPVDNRTLAYAVLESYHTLLPKGRYPMVFLFLDLPPAGVDVNVHPSKREVRFRDEVRVRGFVIRALLGSLRDYRGSAITPAPKSETLKSEPTHPVAVVVSTSPAATVVGSEATKIASAASSLERVATATTSRTASPTPISAAARRIDPGWRQLGTVDGGYSIFETKGGLILLDRRAAAERVWYERLLRQYAGGRMASQRMLLPIPLELDPLSVAVIEKFGGLLGAHGVQLEPFGRDFFRIESVPEWLDPGQAEAFVREVLDLAKTGRIDAGNTDRAREEIARAAAVRAGASSANATGADLVYALVGDLLACANPHASPLGRPTFVEVSSGEIARRFHKVVPARQVDED